MAHQSEIEKLERRYEEKPSQWFAALAEEYRRSGDVDLALEIVRQGLEERSTYVSGHIVLARCLLQQDNDPEAEKTLKQVLELDSENIIALKVLSEIRERAGDSDGALRWLDSLLEVDPMNQEAQEAAERLRPGGVPEQAEVAEAGPSPMAGLLDPEESSPAEAADLELEAPGMASPFQEEAVPEAVGEAAPPGDQAIVSDFVIETEGSSFGDVGAPEDGLAAEASDLVVEPAGGVSDDVPVLETIPADTPEESGAEAFVGSEPAEVDVPDVPDEPVSETMSAVSESIPEGQGAGLPLIAVESEVVPAEAAGETTVPVSEAGPPIPDETSAPVVEPVSEPESVAGGTEPPQEPVSAEVEAPAAESVTPPAGESAPDLVVTETMAEVYVNQGLLDEARQVYQQLLSQRPGDANLEARLADLEATRAEAGPPEATPVAYAARETGGRSARALLVGVLAAVDPRERPSADPVAGLPIVSPDEAPVAGTPAAELDPPPSLPEAPSPLEEAFEAAEPAEELPGEPTRPARDDVSLSAVFEDGAPVAAPGVDAPLAEPPAPPPEGVSFDQFYGDTPPAAPASEPSDSSADGDEALEEGDFRDWLKGLKS